MSNKLLTVLYIFQLNMLMRLQEAANYSGNQSQDSDNASMDSNLTHDSSMGNDLQLLLNKFTLKSAVMFSFNKKRFPISNNVIIAICPILILFLCKFNNNYLFIFRFLTFFTFHIYNIIRTQSRIINPNLLSRLSSH